MLKGVSPLFNVPACALIARKEAKVEKVAVKTLKNKLPAKNVKWAIAESKLKSSSKQMPAEKLFPPALMPSSYLKSIRRGADIFPRSLWFVQPVTSAYGTNQAKPALETLPEAIKTAKKPWQNIYLKGEVEAQYLYATMLGRQLLPFGYTNLSLAVIPVEDKPAGLSIVNKEMAQARGHSGLYEWLKQVESLWNTNKKTGNKSSIYEWLDYIGKLTSYHSTGYHTVMYNRAGTNLASCVLSEHDKNIKSVGAKSFITDTDMYLYQSKNETEVHYLCAFLNAPYVDEAIKPHQTMGQWGARDIHRRPFEVVPIPKFDPQDEKHKKLAEISKKCHQKVAQLKLEGKSIGNLRGKVRKALANELAGIDNLVRAIV